MLDDSRPKTAADGTDTLSTLLPMGMVASRAWLLAHGLSKDRLDNHVKSGRLRKLARGVFCQQHAALNWENVVASFSLSMDIPAYAGGLTALEEYGYSQYLTLGAQRVIEVYSTLPEPSWLQALAGQVEGVRFRWHKTQRLWQPEAVEQQIGVTHRPWSPSANAQVLARAETAYIELLHEVPEQISFEHADEIMQGLTSLSPRKVNLMLAHCKSIKAKRLFCWFADRHSHSWWKTLNDQEVDLGKGKRVIEKGGRLDKRYWITVPASLYQDYPNDQT
ncbi:type IV toxin-antitoxin system AbiEi family antitoxin domain-containing protein [Pseudomonas abyssi]|uniref:type IV toxin-antitoxin system AbiEi family antitoxin domain-containing protein n=1 Tax=Pseudomonas abyssi TaxID=170540 RepID=UPI003C7ED1D7